MAIEEPEIHLHPQAERKLYRFMEEFSAATQMFVVTHSPVFVQPGNIRGLYRVVKGKEGTITHTMDEKDYINKDRLEQELNAENCEMFFSDKVLLVEGISDKIFMEGLIDKYCKSTDEIKVVSAYSKDNFEISIAFSKVRSNHCGFPVPGASCDTQNVLISRSMAPDTGYAVLEDDASSTQRVNLSLLSPPLSAPLESGTASTATSR